MRTPKLIAKVIPGLPSVYHILHDKYVAFQLKSKFWSKNTEDVFTDIYRRNKWDGKDSVSGKGSDSYQTRVIASELPALFTEFNVATMLDIPCGDFHWMKSVDLKGINYTGADIVKYLIQGNKDRYERDNIRFRRLDLIKDKLPKVDLIFCRDCLVHFSFEDIFFALHNICESQSEFLLTTTFTARKDNHNIVTGRWRDINLELPPFLLPKPLKIMKEGCTEVDGAYKDKALGLWRIADIRESLTRRSA